MKMVVVLDTNVMLVCPSPKSSLHPLFLMLKSGNISLCLSNEILLEYEEVFTKKMGVFIADKYLKFILELPSLIYVRPYYSWNLIVQDPDDNKFVDCAVAGNADYIITEDKHFDELKHIDFPNVSYISSGEFLKRFNK
jgi:putative PIN family toxin of toxin-antitoxin system